LVLFNFLIGNEDAHLKNFSLITENNTIVLSPVYDLVNTTIELPVKEELALTLHGKKNNLTRKDFIHYFGMSVLKMNPVVINDILDVIRNNLTVWEKLIKASFLSENMQSKYLNVLEERSRRLGL